ncbi:MAG: SGNH/GDSL hydrolase family protein [Candidatus Fimenecus sp.]
MDIKQFERNTKYDYWQRWKRRRFIKLNRKCKKGQIVLLGDSITEMFDVHLLDGCSDLEIYNRGIGGDTTNRLLQRLEKNVLRLQPSRLILLIGTNDFGRGADGEYVFENIKTIVSTIEKAVPNIQITLQCVYPVNGNQYPLEPGRNEKIDTLNSQIKAFAQQNGYGIIDITDALKNENGALDAQYSDDGVHPNAKGFEIVANAIKAVIA